LPCLCYQPLTFFVSFILPGPGAYDAATSTFGQASWPALAAVGGDEGQQMGRDGARKKKKAFASTSRRFVADNKMSGDPGPGAYATRNHTMVAALDRKMFGRNASFGNTAVRFQHKTTQDTVPGPGSYVEKTMVRPRRAHGVFVSRSTRYIPGVDKRYRGITSNTGPAPNEYFKAPRSKAPLEANRLSSMFAPTKQSRFAKSYVPDAMTTAVGPGTYSAPRPAPISKAGAGSAFRSTNSRFSAPPPSSVVPGPGSYEEVVSRTNFNKPSFNITIGANELF
jgi:hypothetical protein